MFPVNDIQVILFDLDGTLRFNRPASFDVFLRHAVSLGATDDQETHRQVIRWTHYYWAQSPELAVDLAKYGELNDAFWTNYAVHCLILLGQPAEQAAILAPEMNRYMNTEHQPEDWIPEDVPNTLGALKNAGFRLGVLSNRDESVNAYLEQIGLSQYFELCLVAGEIAAWKPDPQSFRHALQRLGLAAQQVVYVGDNYFADILGAEAAGIWPVLYDPTGIFPEAQCPIIHTIGELAELFLNGRSHRITQTSVQSGS